MNSIVYRITGLMFLFVAFTVVLLIYLADYQMDQLFREYLLVMGRGGMRHHMGQAELTFLASVHRSLTWVGAILIVLGLMASYSLARSITVPLRRLSLAAEAIEQGDFEQRVPISSKDEVGHLAKIFNRMAKTLENNMKLRQQLLANIAHELRTPIAIIKGHLEGMLDDVIDLNKEEVASLHEETIRLNRLITDLKDLSLAEVGQLSLDKQPTNINYLVRRTIQLMKTTIDEKKMVVQCNLNDKLPEIHVDPDRISQVISNIFVNALRYTPDRGKVSATTGLEKMEGRQWVKIAVSDNGPGIAPDDIPHIFDHFYRGEKSRDRKSGGSGLGLAIVKQLVEFHGGKVMVDSSQGAGTTFFVYLPYTVVR
ncbi:sensor histidine kinase [Sporomusa acidovorans]|uniref:sensor histidine kinase n=1 Tax=Sporomusa acidovorans TaxID=112900 RepID=UPI00088CCF67|nr:ATP-binding protein [Sporomusa acidovorans]OZC19072.1 signal transduction histidine-protein kinase BaeS [Sporomusa acidovorans DSM 3132]SDD66346.1 two-component system, OmpR family, sensor histidine kinase BaeS [Sporomusa acidovorans]